MKEIHGAHAAAPEHHGNVEDRPKSQAQNRRMVVEGGYDIRGAAAAKDLQIREHVLGPRRVLLFLSAAGRIDRRQAGVDPLDFGPITVELHDGEEAVPDGLTAELFDRAADRERLVRSAQRLGERAQIFGLELSAIFPDAVSHYQNRK